jgi:SAM-dependent methyltransferase
MGKKRRTEQILELIPTLLREGRVLDVGTGRGDLAHGLQEMGYEVEALDIDPSLCEHPDLMPTQRDLMDGLPCDDASFDIVTATEVIEHMEDPFKVIREFHRVLRPGGVLLLTTPNYGNIEKRLHYLHAGTLPRPLGYEGSSPTSGRAHHHISPMCIPRLYYLLETNGFDIAHISTANRKTKIWLLLPIVILIWLYVHLLWTHKRREAYRIRDQMNVILGGRTLVVVSRKRD